MLGVEISQHIISQENTIMDLSTLNKGSLVRADKFGHHLLKAVGKQLGNNFIEEVAKRYGPELIQFISTFTFGNQRDEGVTSLIKP
jgi:hypothetical protein